MSDTTDSVDRANLMECPACGSQAALRRGVETCPKCGESCRTATDGGERRLTRRETVTRAGTTVIMASGLASVMDVASADTPSGDVELDTTATVPTDTSVDITVYADTDGSGTANNSETQSISDGTTTTAYSTLSSVTGEGDVLWLEVALSTSDDTVTPSVDSATLTLPDATTTTTTTSEGSPTPGSDEPQTLEQIWNNPRAFAAAFIIAIAGIGLWSRSLTLAAWGAYVAFLHIAFTADGFPMFENIAIVTLVLVFLGFAFKLIRLEFEGES